MSIWEGLLKSSCVKFKDFFTPNFLLRLCNSLLKFMYTIVYIFRDVRYVRIYREETLLLPIHMLFRFNISLLRGRFHIALLPLHRIVALNRIELGCIDEPEVIIPRKGEK